MPGAAATQQRGYEPMQKVRELTLFGKRILTVKVGAAVGAGALLLALGAAVALSARVRLPGASPRSLPEHASELELAFQVNHFPDDCRKYMRYMGCQKAAWACEEDDGTDGWKCCCQKDIWDVRSRRPTSSTAGGGGAAVVLRLANTVAAVCLGARAPPSTEGGAEVSLAPCGSPSTHFERPGEGNGAIRLASQAGKCLGVSGANLKDLEVVDCDPQSEQQAFRLTKGNKGLLKWSHGKSKCFDTENGRVDAGNKMVLKDCVFWPEKTSQQFVVEDLPKPSKVRDLEQREAKNITGPSLYCVSLMLFWTYEVDMLRSHLAKKVGIFACDDWAVYSNQTVELAPGTQNSVMAGSLKAKIGGKYHTALNTPVFRRFWWQLIKDGKAWKHDWIVKMDPDAVFFPDRLKEMLANEYPPKGSPNAAVWLNNCQLGLHGPIEVFTTEALGIYQDRVADCDEVAKKHGQEDVYLDRCFTALGVVKVDALNLLLESEWACNERPSSSSDMPPCYDRQVSFHPFKTVKSYFFCHDRAAKMSWRRPLYINSVAPSKRNHHHA